VRWPRKSGESGARTLVRVAAGAAIAAGIVVPLARRRLRIPPAVTVGSLIAAPFGLAVLAPRSKTRDVALFAQQMWGFTMAHELPFDDEARAKQRLHINYPISADLAIGRGELPTVRLQKALAAPEGSEPTLLDKSLSAIHWSWFFEPHLALVWILLRDEDQFPRAARQMGAAYDLGCLVYALVPTAPPWWASEHRYTPKRVRRIMVEVGERVWGRAWPRMYDSLGGNPWAAMPSLHFGTSVLAAILLSEHGRIAGTAGWGYALALGFALVYLGEHYVADLAAGAALVIAVRRGEPLVEPLAQKVSLLTQRLEAVANG
jgi:membrane-associated phospholipid phosphatase